MAVTTRRRSVVRSLPGEQVDGQRVQLVAGLVDGVVVGDDLLGDLDVGVEDRLGGTLDGGADQGAHLDEVAGDLVEVAVEDFTHYGLLWAGSAGDARQQSAPV